MKSAIITKYGDYESISIVNKPETSLDQESVRVQVHASSLNKADELLFLGKPKIIRLFMGFKAPKNKYPGADFSGVITNVGQNVKAYKVGDQVFGDASAHKFGAFGSFLDIPTKFIYLKPTNLSHQASSALPMPAVTALLAINKANLKPNQNVLVYGASGGVGTNLSQILASMDVEVTAVAGKKHHEKLNKIHIKNVKDYKDPEFKLEPKQYDVIFAVNGYQKLKTYAKSLKKKGKIVIIGGDMRQLNEAMLKGLFYRIFKRKRIISIFSNPNVELLKEVKELAEKGILFPDIAHVYKLEDIRQTYKDYNVHKYSGKYIIDMIGNN